MNPNRDVFILFAAQVGIPSDDLSSSMFKALTSYPNINFRSVDWYNYAIHTPAEGWINKDIILTSPYYIAHLSDFIRLVTLYKYGGIHFDLDFIIKKSLEDMPENFAGAERNDSISNAVVGFQSNNIGHKIVEMILRFVQMPKSPLFSNCFHSPFSQERIYNITIRANGHPADLVPLHE